MPPALGTSCSAVDSIFERLVTYLRQLENLMLWFCKFWPIKCIIWRSVSICLMLSCTQLQMSFYNIRPTYFRALPYSSFAQSITQHPVLCLTYLPPCFLALSPFSIEARLWFLTFIAPLRSTLQGRVSQATERLRKSQVWMIRVMEVMVT